MTHLYDTVEPSVLSQELLRSCVLAQGPEGEAGRLAKEEGIEFSEVRKLRLDFQNILRIENLWQFTNLETLQLDNNIIERIEGLDTLVHLKWLDLSFNNIEEVAGLDKLVNLQDLSLAHNRLTVITGFGSLTRLQSLSLASNELGDLEQVKALCPLSQLQSLCLSGNPLASEESYQHFAIAFIPSLIYLDFKMIFTEKREAACEVFADALAELEMTEREERRRREDQAAIEQQEATYKAGYVDDLQGSVLYESLFAEDSDAHRIQQFPGVADMLHQYKEKCVQYCEHLTKVGLEEKEKREVERGAFHHSLQQAYTLSQQRSVDIVTEYEALKHRLLGSASPEASTELQAAITTLEHSLMKTEMQLVEQLDEIIKDFERNYSDKVGGFLEQVQSHMTQLRELENSHHERVTEIGLSYLEQHIKNQLEEEPPEELRKLLSDKDTLVGALNTAHDGHLLAIDSKEDSITLSAKADLNRLLEDLQEAEHSRNRQKVTEIQRYIAQQQEEGEATAHQTA